MSDMSDIIDIVQNQMGLFTWICRSCNDHNSGYEEAWMARGAAAQHAEQCDANGLRLLRYRVIDAARAYLETGGCVEHGKMQEAMKALDALERPDPWRLLARAHSELNSRIGASRNRRLESEINTALAMQEQADD